MDVIIAHNDRAAAVGIVEPDTGAVVIGDLTVLYRAVCLAGCFEAARMPQRIEVTRIVVVHFHIEHSEPVAGSGIDAGIAIIADIAVDGLCAGLQIAHLQAGKIGVLDIGLLNDRIRAELNRRTYLLIGR